MMKLSVIIVSWNTRELLADCLASVYAHPPLCEFDVWVVDNASGDGSAQMVCKDFPQVKLIENEGNVGFAQANNQAIQASVGQYVLLLNPDTVVRPGALAALVEFLDNHPQAGGAGSRLLNPDSSLQPSCHPLPTLSREWWRLFHLDVLYAYGRYHMQKWDTQTPRKVDIVQGASFVVRREVLDKIGLMDKDYFMYSEEVDLCHRLKQAGWELYWVPQSEVVHYGGQSTKQVAAKMFLELYRGKLYYFRKYHGPTVVVAYKLILAAASFPRLLLFVLAWLQRPPIREQKLQLALNYGRLLKALPGM